MVKISFKVFIIFLIFNINSITIILDPSGDAHYTGRIIGENFERGISSQFTNALKKELDLLRIKTIITRYPGEALEPLQNANLANKTKADIYINFNFYYESNKDKNRCISVYYSLYNPSTDLWDIHNNNNLAFSPYNCAYKASVIKSKEFAETFFKEITLKQEILLGMPFKPLIGILIPAFGIEIGLNKSTDWKECVTPVVNSIKACINII